MKSSNFHKNFALKIICNAWHCFEITSGLLRYLKLKNPKEPLSLLPADANRPLGQKIPSLGLLRLITCLSKLLLVNSDIIEASSTTSPFIHGSYAVLTTTQFKIGKRANKNGAIVAIRYYAKWYTLIWICLSEDLRAVTKISLRSHYTVHLTHCQGVDSQETFTNWKQAQ